MINPAKLSFPPPHPGEALREDVLPELNISQSEFARHLGVSAQTLSQLINEKRSLSVDLAVRLAKALDVSSRFWLTMQMQHDLWYAEQNIDTSTIEPIRRVG